MEHNPKCPNCGLMSKRHQRLGPKLSKCVQCGAIFGWVASDEEMEKIVSSSLTQPTPYDRYFELGSPTSRRFGWYDPITKKTTTPGGGSKRRGIPDEQ